MGAIKLTSQSRLQTRKRGGEGGRRSPCHPCHRSRSVVTSGLRSGWWPSPSVGRQGVPAADISLCSQPYLCPASGTSILSGLC